MAKIPNYKKKRRRRRRKVRLRFFTIILIISALIISIKTDIFNIKKIEVEGNKVLSDEQIVNKSEVKVNENLLFINKKKIIKGIKDYAYIDDVKVRRRLPDRIIIIIEERQNLAQIENNNLYQIINKDGYILQNLDEKVEGLPMITNLDIDQIEVGKKVQETNRNSRLLQFLREIDEQGLKKDINIIDANNIDDIVIYLTNQVQVDFGPLYSIEYKMNLLNTVLLDIEKKGINSSKIILNRGKDAILVTEPGMKVDEDENMDENIDDIGD